MLSGAEVWPIIEGGKGIGVSNGATAGAFAAAGAVGTISGVFPPYINEQGEYQHMPVKSTHRKDRSREVIEFSIEGSIREIKKAFEISKGKGRIHLNILWGIAGAEEIIERVLEKTQGMLNGITCGAGMPYKLASIASKYKVFYYPIISSARAFNILWSRAYKEFPQYLGGLVYEDPWKAGGHNGLSNKDNPDQPEDPYKRVQEIRDAARKVGMDNLPVIMAGGVWDLKNFEGWIDNQDLGPICFQIGTRSLLTQESPISEQWKKKLMNIKKGDIILNNYSSTGFYSSALNNSFLAELQDRAKRQIEYKKEPEGEFRIPINVTNDKKVFVSEQGRLKAQKWLLEGFSKILETPESSLLFLTKEKARQIKTDQRDCKGCLAACKFSSWSTDAIRNFTTGILPDPRSFCILKTLQNLICGYNIDHELVFSGHNTYKFSEDPLYANGYIPTVKELILKMIKWE